MSNAIAGNNNFTKVENVSGSLSVSEAKVSTLDVEGTVSLGLLVHRNERPGLGSIRQVVGYAPIGFATAAEDSIMFLNVKPQSPVATSVNSPQLLLLPVGAKVVGAVVTNNGKTISNSGTATYDITAEVWSASPSANGNIANNMTLNTINLVGHVGFGHPTSSDLGTAGTQYKTTLSSAANNTGVNVQTLGGSNTSGDLAVLINYLL